MHPVDTLRLLVVVVSLFFSAIQSVGAPLEAQKNEEPGLLFHLSAQQGLNADFAKGDRDPTFCQEVETIPDGAVGHGIRCGNLQRLAYAAPGNIYAARGTLAFFWRSRDPVGPTEFPIFRVAYADHSSWDMVWLRMDYNGHGFDAFVTDVNLARVRVSTTLETFPKPNAWTHLALVWDEATGLRFYINGKLAAKKDTPALLDTGLDQFGPHSRIISPHQVQSDYNFVRGGDIDEIRIYDRALDDESVAILATGNAIPPRVIEKAAPPNPALARNAWLRRYGWEPEGYVEAKLPGPQVAVRKVQILDAYDLKRWWWKANDGIRETTWPGVYNRSRIEGRNDYFQLPDWDCYSLSGKAIRFIVPDESWNQLEVSGAAYGSFSFKGQNPNEMVRWHRAQGRDYSIFRFEESFHGGELNFENTIQETPIGELSLLSVREGAAPEGSKRLSFVLGRPNGIADPAIAPIAEFVVQRHPETERSLLVAKPAGVQSDTVSANQSCQNVGTLPIVHIAIPCTWDSVTDGLDGIELEWPALPGNDSVGGAVFLQVHDPLWIQRSMLDFSFTAVPGKSHKLWLDFRDRLLPKGRPLYLHVISASPNFSARNLYGAHINLVFKARDEALREHVLDRFNQVKDSYAMLVEERPNDPHLNLGVRFRQDLRDLLRAAPDHPLALRYAAVAGLEGFLPKIEVEKVPDGVPGWAFRQVQLLDYAERFVRYYIEHRQIENGEMGGGLSDDTDLLNYWPGLALLGVDSDKVLLSMRRLLDACFSNGMFTNGLSTIQADELHSYEEGINTLSQLLLVDHGNPLQLERAMETARALERITGINQAGHRHFRSSYYSGTKMATDGVWGWSKAYSYLVIHPDLLLVDFNGNPRAKKLLLELADGLLAHRHFAGNGRPFIASAVHFESDQEGRSTRPYVPYALFWQAYCWTGDARYLQPIMDSFPVSLHNLNANVLDIAGLREKWAELPKTQTGLGFGSGKRLPDPRTYAAADAFLRWQLSGDKKILEELYTREVEIAEMTEYINTEGSLWIDRVGLPTGELQRARLGGIALVRNSIDPGHAVGWRFVAPARAKDLGILIGNAKRNSLTILVYNMSERSVETDLIGWGVDRGEWRLIQGVDTDSDDKPDRGIESSLKHWGRSRSLRLSIPPRATTVLNLELVKADSQPWQLPDVGVDRTDIQRTGNNLAVTIHSLGSVPCPAGKIVVRRKDGSVIAEAPFAPMEDPLDLQPRRQIVSVLLPATLADAEQLELGLSLVGDSEEITFLNNRVLF